jgi:hypothetical protein
LRDKARNPRPGGELNLLVFCAGLPLDNPKRCVVRTFTPHAASRQRVVDALENVDGYRMATATDSAKKKARVTGLLMVAGTGFKTVFRSLPSIAER